MVKVKKRSGNMKKDSMVKRIKKQIARSSMSLGKFIRIGTDEKVKIRFISNFDSAVPITEHDKWGKLMPVPCLKVHLGKDCPFCKVEGVRTREVYAWTVWDYDSKEKKVLKFAPNSVSPIQSLVTALEAYGTLTDRAYVISKVGSGKSTKYGCIALDKKKFKKKIKPFTEEEIIKMCLSSSSEITWDEIDELDDFVGDEDDVEEDGEEVIEFEDEDEEVEEDTEDEDDEEEDEEDEEEEEDEDEDDLDFEDDEDEDEPVKKKKSKKKKSKK
jgi:hypothetical protein